MVETKYNKYFITECTRNVEKFGKMVSMRNIKPAFEKSNVDGGGRYYSKPFVMIPTKHVHKYDDYLFFLGTDFEDIDSFDAEWELCMGDEGEKHIITRPTIVFIPAGVVHCPLSLIKANKPTFFLHLMDHSVEGKRSGSKR